MPNLAIQTPAGHTIAITRFESLRLTRRAVLIASATGVRQEIYYKFAQFLSENGYHAYTFDYTGIGRSRKRTSRRTHTTASAWATNDLEAVIKWVLQSEEVDRLVIIGHSIGGQLIGLAPSSEKASGLILVGAQTGYWKFWKGSQRWKMYVIWHALVPILTHLFRYFPGKKLGLSENLPKGMALEWARWCRSKNYFFDHHRLAQEKYNSVHCPVISISAEDDSYAPRASVDWLAKRYINASRKRIHLTPSELGVKHIGHFGFFKSRFSTSIWAMLLDEIRHLTKGK